MKYGVILALLLVIVPMAFAYDFGSGPTAAEKATFDQILQPVMKIYNMVKYIASAVAGIILLFAGVNYIISGSDPGKRDGAKNMAAYVVIGLVVIWAAPLVVNFVAG